MALNFYPFASTSRKLIATLSTFFALSLASHAQPYTIFSTETPVVASANDGPDIETAVKFQVLVDGTISGIRFYQGGNDDGAHTGNLWDPAISTTIPLGTATSGSEATPAALGWRDIIFASPVTVSTGIVYTASVYNPNGYYNYTNAFFVSALTNANNTLTALVDGGAGGDNGAYQYGGGLPTAGNGQQPNYFIDVLFTPNTPLPVKFSSFTATASGLSVALNWKTESEEHNKGFDVQRSNNGLSWSSIAFVNGVGESSTTRDYGYVDKNLAPGKYQYRLMQTDFDGHKTPSKVVSVQVSGEAQLMLHTNYPNPATGNTSIRFDLTQSSRARLSLLDISGREIKVLSDAMEQPGTHIINLNAAELTRRLYFIRLQAEGKTIITKMVVQ